MRTDAAARPARTLVLYMHPASTLQLLPVPRAMAHADENSADDAVPQPHVGRVFGAAASADKSMHVIRGATHYYVGPPQLMRAAVDLCVGWLRARNLLAE